MRNWTCHNCDGNGMRYDEDQKAMVLCDCPAGDAKRRWVDSTPEETARRRPGRAKKRDKVQEPIPF